MDGKKGVHRDPVQNEFDSKPRPADSRIRSPKEVAFKLLHRAGKFQGPDRLPVGEVGGFDGEGVVAILRLGLLVGCSGMGGCGT